MLGDGGDGIRGYVCGKESENREIQGIEVLCYIWRRSLSIPSAETPWRKKDRMKGKYRRTIKMTCPISTLRLTSLQACRTYFCFNIIQVIHSNSFLHEMAEKT